MTIINTTPHVIHLHTYTDGEFGEATITTYEPLKCDVRMTEVRAPVPDLRCTDLVGLHVECAPDFDAVSGLPVELDDGHTTIIVSMPVGQFLRANPVLWKGHVVGPDTGNGKFGAVRNAAGQILGTKGLVLYK